MSKPSADRVGRKSGWGARAALALLVMVVVGACASEMEPPDESTESVQQLARIVDPATPVGSVGWVLKGTAAISGSSINLTPATGSRAGTAFHPSAVDPKTLTVSFRSSITGAANNADGIAFVMADATRLPANAVTTGLLGATGGGLGFSGIPGLAVVLDTYKNATDPSSNYVGVTDGATTPSVPDQLRLLATNQVPSLQGTHDFTVTVTPGQIAVTMDGTSVLTASVTLPSSVYFGFTAGTGGNPPAVQSVSNITVDATLGTSVPVLAASPIPPNSAPTFVDRMAFLYTGTGKVQTGVAAGTINAERASVIRGHVVGDDKTTPATGTVVTVLGHPEYGQTVARADGWFDLAVNGGGPLTLDYQRAGHLPVQRTVMTRYKDTTVAPEVVLTVPYAHPTDRFTAGLATWQSVRGTPTAAGVDADGKRQAVVLFPPNTHITNYPDADGEPNIVQITEFTRDRGQDRMPGDLPPSSGYTYAVDVAIPAAAAAGVASPQFDQNVITYVTNFTGYPTGQPVPLGTYDRAKGAWVAEASGLIVKVVSRTGGLADLDVNATTGADPTLYASLGITDGERQKLGALSAEYPDGTSLWRVTMNHFSNWDLNWGYAPPSGAAAPPGGKPDSKKRPDSCEISGSIIGCESQTLGEELPVVGTPFALSYQSERTPGYAAFVDFTIGPESSATAPTASVLTTHVIVRAAGREFVYSRAGLPAVGERYHWKFDGLDAYGRKLRGSVPVDIRVGYEFGGVPATSTRTFGSVDGAQITGNRAARTIIYWSRSSAEVRLEHAALDEGLGGWMLTNHHHFDPGVGAALGDGRVLKGESNQFAISTYAGGGIASTPRTEGMSAKDMYIASVYQMEFAANGDLFLHYMVNTVGASAIDMIRTDGTVLPITGLPPLDGNSTLVDGAEALHAKLPSSIKFALASDGTIYFVAGDLDSVWKITNEPVRRVRRVSKAGPAATPYYQCTTAGTCGDGGPVELAEFRYPQTIVIEPDGSLIVGDNGHSRLRRIDPRGIVSNSEIPPFGGYYTLFRGENGERYGIDSNNYLWELSAPGGRRLRSGSSSVGPYYGNVMGLWCDWAPNSTAALPTVLAWNGGFLVKCWNNSTVAHTIRYVNSAGVSTIVAGSLNAISALGDGGPATRANLTPGGGGIIPALAARGPSDFFFAGTASAAGARIRRVSTTSPSLLGDGYIVPDGELLYDFDAAGRHRSTRSSLRGTTLYSFGYDNATGYLTSITDRDGLVTQIARSGTDVTLTAPFGQQTKLALDANGYLKSVTSPNTAEVTRMTHGATGLMTDFWDARSNHHTFTFDADGRLTRDTDAVAGSLGTRLVASSNGALQSTVTITSPEGRPTVHFSDSTSSATDRTRVEQRTITRPGTATTTRVRASDGQWSSSRAAGATFLSSYQVLSSANDPRWGSLAPFVSAAEEKDGTRTLTRSESRTATLSTPFDPYSVTSMSIANSVAASGLATRTWTRAFQYGSPSTWLTTSPEGRQTRTTLDSKERVTQVEVLGTDPVALASIQYRYDSSGRVDQVTNGTRVFGTTYSAAGWVSGTTAPESMNTSVTSRDANGRALTVVLPGNRTVGTSYDLAGNIASVTPPGKTAHAFTSNEQNLLSLYAPPTTPQTPKDTGYVYDKDGLLLSVSNPALPVSYTYDATNGRPTSMTDAVSVLFGYDTAGRRNTLTTSDNVATTLTYDGTRVTAETTTGAWPVPHTLNRSYSHFGELASWGLDNATPDVVTFDKDGLLTSNGPVVVARGNTGLVKTVTVGNITETYGYNTNGELTSATASGVAGGYSVTYQRDTLGRITKKTETIGGTTVATGYAYDTAGRLWQVYANGSTTPTSTFTYDANGNRAGGTYDGQDRLTALGSTTYTYGPNGELKTKTDTSGTTTYTYDAHGNLRRVVPPAPGATIDYVIDGRNRRVGKLLGGNFVVGWVYDGPRLVGELDASGALVSRFFYVATAHTPCAMVRGGVAYRVLSDELGSPRVVIHNTTGAVVQRIDYDPWGKVMTDTSPGFQPFGFAAGVLDRATGLTRFGARDYDANSGRWTSKDTTRFDGGLNLYGYANNDPVNYIDSTGENPVAIAVGVGVGVAAYLTYLALQNAANAYLHRSDLPDMPHMPYDPVMPPGGPTTAPPWSPPSPPVPDAVPLDDAGGVCGGDQNKKDDRKRNRCIAACRHLLPDPQGDLQSSNFHRCVAECMAR